MKKGKGSSRRIVVWHPSLVKKGDRAKRFGYQGATVWLTGLPSSGKSTIAHEVERILVERAIHAYVLDGDNIRHGLNKDLGFSPEDREENIRRLGEVAHLFAQANVIVITAFISPYRKDRDQARALAGHGEFIEVYVKASLKACEARDPKGLYKKARAGEIPEFTGVSAPYEPPRKPELILNTERETVEESAHEVIHFLEKRGIIPEGASLSPWGRGRG